MGALCKSPILFPPAPADLMQGDTGAALPALLHTARPLSLQTPCHSRDLSYK